MADEISKSPQRHTFLDNMAKKRIENGEVRESEVDYWEEVRNTVDQREKQPEWKENNLEYDLRATDWILTKVRNSESYAQNLYAAMCNNEFVRREIVPILKNEKWSCSWRSAGGIVANMRQEGDYIDWYCSGIGRVDECQEEGGAPTETSKYVPEATVTDEIRNDLKELGWIVLTD